MPEPACLAFVGAVEPIAAVGRMEAARAVLVLATATICAEDARVVRVN